MITPGENIISRKTIREIDRNNEIISKCTSEILRFFKDAIYIDSEIYAVRRYNTQKMLREDYKPWESVYY